MSRPKRMRKAYNLSNTNRWLQLELEKLHKDNAKLAEENFTMHELCKEFASEVFIETK